MHAIHLPDAPTASLEPPDLAARVRADGSALLARTATNVSALHPEVPVKTDLSDHSPAHALEAASREASRIVTGTRGHGGFTGMLLGSVTHALAAHTSCPLVVVPHETPTDAIDEVVLGIGPKHSAAAIRYAFEAAELLLGAASRARLLVVGAQQHRGPLAVGAGYVVDGVIAHSPVPVAVIPTRV